jgi:hypothetical protein
MLLALQHMQCYMLAKYDCEMQPPIHGERDDGDTVASIVIGGLPPPLLTSFAIGQ